MNSPSLLFLTAFACVLILPISMVLSEQPERLAKIATELKFRAETPWRKSKVEDGYVAIYRRYNGAEGTDMKPVLDTTSFNETNIQLSGKTDRSVNAIVVETEIYNEKYLTDSLAIYFAVLKSIDPEIPMADFVTILKSAVNKPQKFGKWTLEYKPHRAGYDIETKLTMDH